MPLVDSIPVILVIHRLRAAFSARPTRGSMRRFGCGRERRRRRKRRRRKSPSHPGADQPPERPQGGTERFKRRRADPKGRAGPRSRKRAKPRRTGRGGGARRTDPPWPRRRATPRRTGEPRSRKVEAPKTGTLDEVGAGGNTGPHFPFGGSSFDQLRTNGEGHGTCAGPTPRCCRSTRSLRSSDLSVRPEPVEGSLSKDELVSAPPPALNSPVSPPR